MQPLFYAALAAAGGIALAAVSPALAALPASVWAWLAAGLFATAALARRRPRWVAALALAACVAAGAARARQLLAHPPPPPALVRLAAHLEPNPRARVFVTGYLRDTPESLYDGGRLSAVRLVLAAVSLGPSPAGVAWPVSGGIRLYAYPPRPPGSDLHPLPPRNPAWASALQQLPAGQGLALQVHLRPLHSYLDPGVADFAASARRQGVRLTATLPLDAWRIWPGLRAPRLSRWRAAVWAWLSRRLDRLASPQVHPRLNGLLRGMLLGDISRLDEHTRNDFQVDGVYHLLVVAGLHIGILAWLLWFVLRRFRLPRFAAGFISLLLLGGYTWIIAGRTPTLRALFMLAVYFGARWWYRERQALNAVGFAALVLLAWHPLDLFASGWQMSLGAATLLAGVALPVLARTSRPLHRATLRLDDSGFDESLPPRLAQWRLDLRALAERLGWFWRPLGWRLLPAFLRLLLHVFEIIVVSLVLQLGFAGFNAVYFHRQNPWSVLANALLVPAAGLLIPLAWLGVLIGHGFGAIVTELGDLMLRAAAALATWPGAAWRVPSPPGWILVALALAIAAWLAAWLYRPDWRRFAAASLLVATIGFLIAVFPFPPRLPPGLSATILDVGQGDSIVVSFPDGRVMVVDGGPRSAHWDSGEEIVAPYLWSLGLRHVDCVLLTHGHNDHLGGLATVVQNFRPEEVWVTRSLPAETAVRQFLAVVRQSGASLHRLAAGDAFLAGAARLQVLLPPPGYAAGPKAANDDSMVVRVSLGSDAMLLEGDAQAAGEAWLVRRHFDLASAILKVGHHGSATSSSQAFLQAVHPQVAVISVGAGNIYGLPSATVLQRLRQDGARVFLTDRNGAVQCRLLHGRLEVYLFRPLPSSG